MKRKSKSSAEVIFELKMIAIKINKIIDILEDERK